MPNLNITTPELVWPGKYDEDGNLIKVDRPTLPFQKIETVNDTVLNREKKSQLTLFDLYSEKTGDNFEEGWKNKLIWGDNKYVMSSLLANYAGKIDLIYIDPPFDVGADFSFTTQVGDYEVIKEPSIIEMKAYRDTWGQGVNSYLHMMYERLSIMKDLLSDKGSIYVHLDWHVAQYIKIIMDEIFGKDNFMNEIIWCYRGMAVSQNHYVRRHDNIFFYTKGKDNIFNWQYIAEPLEDSTIKKYKHVDKNGRRFRLHGRNIKGSPIKNNTDIDIKWLKTNPELCRVDYLDEKLGSKPRDWFIMDYINIMSNERVNYNTQKPEGLLERIIKVSSNENSLVADFFCGSGTTLAVAEKLGRRWIGCDLGRFAIHTTRKRLMSIEECKPFEILNMGKYERKYWQGITFKDKNDSTEKKMIAHYLKFILELYHAQPIAGLDNIHGKKGRALVHVGSVDTPVTMDEVYMALNDCKKANVDELHVLGWEWEMGMNNIIIPQAKNQFGIKLRLLNIPREVMEKREAESGDIVFFDLAYLETEIEKDKGNKRSIKINLKDFAIPDTELIPEEIRSKIKKWSDYIDYWAVDWDFMNDTFINQWQTFRTRQDRNLKLSSDFHTYNKKGHYQILIKVVDIFGNDTSHIAEVDIK